MFTDSIIYALSRGEIALLAVAGLVAGVGISAVGPGGVLMSIALFAFTDMSPAMIAGTAIISHIGTGLAGTISYAREGHFVHASTRRAAWQLSVGAIIGAPLGMWINTQIGRDGFGVLLAILAMATAFLILRKERQSAPEPVGQNHRETGVTAMVISGIVISAIAAFFGLGGPMLCVPLLVLIGTPMRSSLAVSQLQSIVIATSGTAAYLVHGSVDWPMAVFIMIPQIIGVIVGVKLAHSVSSRTLKYALAAVLIIISPYLVFAGG